MQSKLMHRMVVVLMILMAATGTSCLKKSHHKPPKIDPGFANYISGFTAGVISCESVIRIQLLNNYGKSHVDGSEIREKLFSFSPNIKGKAYWIDARTIEFRPEKKLASGQVFDAEFRLSKLMDVPAKFKSLPFQFQIIEQNFSVENEGLITPDPRNLHRYQLQGTVKSADVADGQDIEKLLRVSQNDHDLVITWTHEADRKVHKFQVDSINRNENTGLVKLSWEGKSIGVDLKGSEKVEIPALKEFKITSVRVIQDPEQYVVLSFSDPIEPGQNLDGLIRINNLPNLKFLIENNTIRIYPSSRQSGQMTLMTDASVRNLGGRNLDKAFSTEISFEDIKPAVNILGNGVILPNSNGLILPFQAVNLSKVDVTIIKIFENNVGQFLQVNNLSGDFEIKRVGRIVYKEQIKLTGGKVIDFGKWNTFSVDLTKLIEKDPGAIYRIKFSFKKSYSLYHCPDSEPNDNQMETVQDQAEDEADDHENWDSGNYDEYYYEYDDYDDYHWNERDNPCKSSYYNRDRFPVRNILASDLGIIAKSNENNQMVFAITDLRTTEPLNDVALEIYNYQNQLIASGKTITDGIGKINVKSKPYLLIAKKGKQRGYLRLDDGSALSLSKFDVSGAVIQKGLKGFLYGERGVWRPGDTLFLTFILEDKNKILPENHPVSLELLDPKGKLTNRMVNTTHVGSFYRFSMPTDDKALTGNWTAMVKVGGATFSKNIKIETIKPNRLKLNLDPGATVINAVTGLNGKLTASWLTGAVARNLRATINVTMTKSSTSFEKFPGYIFDDPGKRLESEELMIFDGKVDEKGEARVNYKFTTGQNSPGMLKANFQVRVFEEGGDFSTDFFTLPYAPYASFVGVKAPEGEKYTGRLITGKNQPFEVVTVDPAGKPVSRSGLEVQVFKINWRWWWNSTDNDQATYEGARSQTPVFQTTCNTQNGKGKFDVKINYPDWGRYFILVKDPVSGHSTGTTVYIDWPEWQSRNRQNDPEAATMLSFSADKNSYKVGEFATLTIPTSGQGRALISIESGTRIIDAYWLEAKAKESTFKFKISSEMAPNIFVHVTLVQPHAQTVNDLPIRMYGILPLAVTDPNTTLYPVINMPDVLKPEQKASIKVSERNGKPMTYTIAIVDEGLLDLTRFKTPDPWSTFYAREALGVKTWDMFDLVLGAYGGKLEQIFAIGGDKDLKVGNPKKVNRFKPMVIYLGPFELKKGASATHTVKIPQYIGSVRTMVIAGKNGAYGAAEKTTAVKKPLMVLATLPRVLGPAETVKLPVTVFAMEKQVKEVTIQVAVNNAFSITGPQTQKITFNQTGDKVVTFDLKVLPKLGVGKVKVVAISGKEKAETTIDIEVRNPNPPITQVIEKGIAARQSWNTDYKNIGMNGTNKNMLEISGFLPVDFNKRLAYLIQYPHGCVEQTTSSGFPQLYLPDVVDLDNITKERISENIRMTIQRLKGFQQSTGGFSYWPGGYNSDDWATSYVGHFMLEAEKKGYALPAGMKESWIRYQTNAVQTWSPRPVDYPEYYSYNDLCQAYRLYTLALARAPQLPAMNRMREMKVISIEARSRLSAAYALAGQTEAAKALMNNYKSREKEDRGMWEIYGSIERDKAMALETMILNGDKLRAFNLAKEIAQELSDDHWMSTQTTAFSLMAVSKYLTMAGTGKGCSFTYSIDGAKPVKVEITKSVWQKELPNSGKIGKVKIENLGGSLIYARIVQTGTPETGDTRSYENNLKMEVTYKDMKGKPLNVSKIVQGTDFLAEVTVTNSSAYGGLKNLALSQIFPSGWEIINTRVNDFTGVYEKDAPTYRDIRDDRVYSYFDLPSGQSRQYVVKLNAAYLGKYFLSGPYCEAMYDNRINSKKGGKWVEVVKNP